MGAELSALGERVEPDTHALTVGFVKVGVDGHDLSRAHECRQNRSPLGILDATLADPVLDLGDGSWGKLRVPKTPEERPYLAAVSEAYHMTVHRLEGEQRFHVALEESGKVADVCMTVSKRPAKRG